MRIDQLSQVDFTNKWLVCTKLGAIHVTERDPLFVRWIKTVFQILTWCLFDVYGHVRINRVAEGLFTHFKVDYKIHPPSRVFYIAVIENLLELRTLGKGDRKILVSLRNKISEF